MTNLFAFRVTNPKDMISEPDPVGADNEMWLFECARNAGAVLAAWGKNGNHLGRAAQVTALFPQLVCLGTNQDGSPRHPLYVSYEQKFISFKQIENPT
jgi:hypothetical protein